MEITVSRIYRKMLSIILRDKMKKKEQFITIPIWHIKLESDIDDCDSKIFGYCFLSFIVAIIGTIIINNLYLNYEHINLLNFFTFLMIIIIINTKIWYYRKKIMPSIWEYFAKYCIEISLELKKLSIYPEIEIEWENMNIFLAKIYSSKISKTLSETKSIDIMNKFYLNLDKLETLLDNPQDNKINLASLSNHFFTLGEYVFKNHKINISIIKNIIDLLGFPKENRIEKIINFIKSRKKIILISFIGGSSVSTYIIARYIGSNLEGALALTAIVFIGMPAFIYYVKKLI